MNKKDLAWLKKQIGKEDGAITRIATCYVNGQTGEARFQEPFLVEREGDEEGDQWRALLKKAVTGKPGVTLAEIEPAKNLLSDLVSEELKDADSVKEACRAIADSYVTDENYAVVLAYGDQDVGEDGTYQFVVASVVPCPLSRPAMIYDQPGNEFRDRPKDRPVGVPAVSFLWPSFDDGSRDLTKVACFSKNAKAQASAAGPAEALFGTEFPMTPEEQKEAFRGMIETAFGGGPVPVESLQDAYDRFAEMKAAAKANGAETELTAGELADMIKADERINEEEKKAVDEFVEPFAGKTFSIDNLAPDKVNVKTEKAAVKVTLDDFQALEATTMDGRRVLVIPLEDAEIDEMRAR